MTEPNLPPGMEACEDGLVDDALWTRIRESPRCEEEADQFVGEALRIALACWVGHKHPIAEALEAIHEHAKDMAARWLKGRMDAGYETIDLGYPPEVK